jgi:hypothetical protein
MTDLVCEAAGCERPRYAKGLCGRHYKQVLRHREVRPDRVEVACAVPGCARKAAARGLVSRALPALDAHRRRAG